MLKRDDHIAKLLFQHTGQMMNESLMKKTLSFAICQKKYTLWHFTSKERMLLNI